MMGQTFSGDDTKALPESQSEEAQLFQRYCGQCHAPPAPTAHTAEEWLQVVSRMKEHMISQARAVPDRTTAENNRLFATACGVMSGSSVIAIRFPMLNTGI